MTHVSLTCQLQKRKITTNITLDTFWMAVITPSANLFIVMAVIMFMRDKAPCGFKCVWYLLNNQCMTDRHS